jgi:hypothetical protein
MNQVTTPAASNFIRNWLFRIGGVAALIVGMFLLIAMLRLIAPGLQPNTITGWLSPFQNNWLIVIFKLHAEFSGIQADSLHGLNPVDIVILALVSILCLSLSAAFGKARKIWTLVAFTLSLMAIVLFIATQIAGRSTIMLAVLIISFVMLGNKSFTKRTIYSGIFASIFLFIGDLTVGVHSRIITILFGIGYVLLMTWLFLTAERLFRLGHGS